MTVIPIVIRTFDTVTQGRLQGLEDLEIRGRIGTIPTKALLRSAKILKKKSWICEETCCHPNSIRKPSSYAVVKNSQKSNNIKKKE